MNKYDLKPILLAARTDVLSDPEKFEYYIKMVPSERKEKIDKYRRNEDKYMSLAAFVLLQMALDESGIDVKDINIFYGENEKPYLKGIDLYFNLSHSDNVAVCVLSKYETGCDVEHADPDRMMIAKRKFCKEEYEMLLSIEDETAQNKLFSRIWTVKESVLKTLGTGLTLPLNSFNVSFDTDEIHVVSDKITTNLYFKEYDIYDGFSLSCCSTDRCGLPENVRFIEL
jgi:4'-phosphopantetheinyl transferase